MSYLKKALIDDVPSHCFLSSVKWAKGDSLDEIAKKWKRKDAKSIWEHPSNKNLVRKRKKPQNLQPGDIIEIPRTTEEDKELHAVIEKWNARKRATVVLVENYEQEIKTLESSMEAFFGVLGKLQFQNQDGAKEREATSALGGAAEKIEQGLRALKNVKSIPGFKLPLETLQKIAGGVKDYRDQLESQKTSLEYFSKAMTTLIKGAETETQRLKDKIKELDGELDVEARKTVQGFCKHAPVKTFAEYISEQMKAAMSSRR